MRVRELMTADVRSCRSTDTLETAARLMNEAAIGAVVVTDAAGRAIGIVTDRDACMAAYVERAALEHVRVAAAMTPELVTCSPTTQVDTAAEVMAAHGVRRLVVVDDEGRPIGLLSVDDLALASARGERVPPVEIVGVLAASLEQHR